MEDAGGTSLGLSAMVAALVSATGLELPSDIAATGAFDTRSRKARRGNHFGCPGDLVCPALGRRDIVLSSS